MKTDPLAFDQEELDGSRRTAVGWLGKIGVGLVASAAGLLRSQSTALAHGYHYQCCHLANPHSSTCRCVAGGLFSWSCCSGTRLYQCMECWDPDYPKGTSCWSGYFECSRGVDLSTRCA